jgi:DNA-directed RNA polymerase subunit RPC12/RpoP
MTDYIEREAAIEAIVKLYRKPIDIYTTDITDELMRVPAADVAPIKRGKWVKTKEYYTAGCAFLRVAWKCSYCGIDVVNTEPIYRIDDWYYCPNCGAKMEADNG